MGHGLCAAMARFMPARHGQVRCLSPASLPSLHKTVADGLPHTGVQKSGRNSYTVKVRVLTVDFERGSLAGVLQIQGLTPSLPELTTFFEGEVCGRTHSFLTKRWGATELDDMKHWARFAPFRPLRSQLARNQWHYAHANREHLFMRLKETFVVPDHKVENIHGASFAGFYYLCVDLSGGTLSSAASPPPTPLTSPATRRRASMSPPTTTVSLPPPSPRRRLGLATTAPVVVTSSQPLQDAQQQSGETTAAHVSLPRPAPSRRRSSYAAAVRGEPAAAAAASFSDATAATAPSAPDVRAAVAQARAEVPPQTREPPATPKDSDVDPLGRSHHHAESSSSSGAISDSPEMGSSSPLGSLAAAGSSASSSTESDSPALVSPPAPTPQQPTSPAPPAAQARGRRRTSAPTLEQPLLSHRSASSSSVEAPLSPPAHATRQAPPQAQQQQQQQQQQSQQQQQQQQRVAWSNASMSGFYYFANAEPYQELQLAYSNKSHSSAMFEFT